MGDNNTINCIADEETRRSFMKKGALTTVGVGAAEEEDAIFEDEDWWQEPETGGNQG